MKIDINKEYKTRDGRDVRVVKIHPETFNCLCYVEGYIGEEEDCELWNFEGKYDLDDESNEDLIEVVETEDRIPVL
mgnify:CR=1 FL=1